MANCTRDDWAKIEATGIFSKAEWKYDPDKIDREVVYGAVRLRTTLDLPCIVHEAFASSGHAPKSRHYADLSGGRPFADAVDLHFKGGSLCDQLAAVLHAGIWGGIGLYPFWEYNRVITPGWHLDLRLHQDNPLMWWQRPTGEYVYMEQDKLFEIARAADLLCVWGP